MEMSTPVRLSAIVYGRVQGVFFRDTARRQAWALGLTGYVRNLPDGTVEVVAEGPQDTLQQLLEQIGTGPSGARVEKVDSHWGDHSGEFDRFEVRY
jgi:acylphosphatase